MPQLKKTSFMISPQPDAHDKSWNQLASNASSATSSDPLPTTRQFEPLTFRKVGSLDSFKTACVNFLLKEIWAGSLPPSKLQTYFQVTFYVQHFTKIVSKQFLFALENTFFEKVQFGFRKYQLTAVADGMSLYCSTLAQPLTRLITASCQSD